MIMFRESYCQLDSAGLVPQYETHFYSSRFICVFTFNLSCIMLVMCGVRFLRATSPLTWPDWAGPFTIEKHHQILMTCPVSAIFEHEEITILFTVNGVYSSFSFSLCQVKISGIKTHNAFPIFDNGQ